MDGKKVGGLSGFVDVNTRSSADLQLCMEDHLDEVAVVTRTALNWSDPIVQAHDTAMHLSLHSQTKSDLLQWDTSVTVDFAENIYAVRMIDVDTAGAPTSRIDADGYFLKNQNTM